MNLHEENVLLKISGNFCINLIFWNYLDLLNTFFFKFWSQ